MISVAILAAGLAATADPTPTPAERPADLAAWIDARLDAAAQAKGKAPPPQVNDEIFLRRAYLELTGTIPSVAEARDFLEDTSATKRERLIQTLLDDKRFPEHTARLWARTLAPAGNTRGSLEMWLRGEFRKNTPFDQLARSVLTAKGNVNDGNSAASFYLAVGNTPERVAEAVARGFLGVRLGCAQCHNHPFAEWTQEHFWGLAVFFAGAGKAPGQINDGFALTITPMNSSKDYGPKFLDGTEPKVPSGKPPRTVLADWMVVKENRYFAANVVNRVWQDLCGVGLVSSVDDLDGVDPAERRLVLDELAAKFAASGFNLRWLVEGICLSKAYQAASTTEPGPARRPVRVLSPEQVLASLDQSLMLKKGRGISIRETPDGRALMQRLEEARGTGPTDFKGGIPQALLLMNGPLVANATTLDTSLTLRAVIEAPFLNETEKLDTLFLAAYSRLPRSDEREKMLRIVRAKPGDKDATRQAYANIFWALLNSPEFVLCP
jgi:hypothetical protein